MSTIKSKFYQIGYDSTASNNFTMYQPATPDGTLRLGQGNAGSATDIVEVSDTLINITADLTISGNAVWHEGSFDPTTKSNTGHTHTESDITDLGNYAELSGDIFTGNVTFNGSDGIESRTGVNGGYGDSSGSGSSWGANIWGMGDAYNGSGYGTSYSVGNYGLSWLRGSHGSAHGYVNEGLYIYRNGSRVAAIGQSGALFNNRVASTGDVTAYYSDERFKDNLGPITYALDKVTSLEGFHFKENELAREFGYNNSNTQIGLSAQEIQKIMPEIVELAPVDYSANKDEDGNTVSASGENYLTVNYAKLVPLLVEAIKELRSELNELRNGTS